MLENLTAEQLLNFDFGGSDLKVVLLNFVAFVLGVVINSFNVTKREGITIGEYWRNHLFNSLTALGALVATFISMATMSPEAPLYAFFSVAFVGDALLHKAPVVQQTAERGVFGEIKTQLVEKHKQHPLKTVSLAVGFVVLVLLIV